VSRPYFALRELAFKNGTLYAALPPERACAGHFTDYPALPVALLVGQLGVTASSLMTSERWRGARAVVNATDLCWAGERVRFEAAHMGARMAGALFEGVPGTASFSCRVVAAERLVCTAVIELEAH
jgi:hypothetical protein